MSKKLKYKVVVIRNYHANTIETVTASSPEEAVNKADEQSGGMEASLQLNEVDTTILTVDGRLYFPSKADSPQTTMKDFLSSIDFKELKKQKQDLLETITFLEKEKMNKKAENLTGIVNLLDKIGDLAVDEYDYDENKIFNLKKEN